MVLANFCIAAFAIIVSAWLIGKLIIKELQDEHLVLTDSLHEQLAALSSDTYPQTASAVDQPAPIELTDGAPANQLPLVPDQTLPPSMRVSPSPPLRPAELAYLCRRGDMSHALIVLGADILQRAIKSPISTQPMPARAAYEQDAWQLARDQVKGWAKRKVGEALPPDMRQDPIGFIKKISKIYAFFAVTLRKFVVKTLEDPRHIRQYISMAGVARLLLQISTMGYQEKLEAGLLAELNRKGMLVSPSRCLRYSRLMMGLALVTGAANFVVALYFISPLSLTVTVWIASAVVAAFVQATFFLREFIPLYTEMKEVATVLGEGGIRLTLLRFVLNIVTALCRLSTTLVFFTSLGIVFLLLHFVFAASMDILWMTVALSMSQLAAIMAALAAWRIAHEAHPTARAVAEINRASARLSKVRAVDAIKAVLRSPDYDSTLSELLAIYGLESLLILF